MFKKINLTKGKLTFVGIVAEDDSLVLVSAVHFPFTIVGLLVHVAGSKPYLAIKPVST